MTQSAPAIVQSSPVQNPVAVQNPIAVARASTHDNATSEHRTFHDAIVGSTKEVFRCMLQWDIEEASQNSNDLNQRDCEVSCCGIVGLSGAARGSIVVNFSAGVAIAATEGFLGAPPKHIDADVIDTVGELTNMIGGSSKDKLPIAGLFLGLPTVIVGKEQSIAFDQGVQMEFFRFSTAHGTFTVEIALCTIA